MTKPTEDPSSEAHAAAADRTSTDKLRDEIWSGLVFGNFEDRFGHGWKRKLAQFAEVPESTVHSWIKAGKTPPWFRTVMVLRLKATSVNNSKRLWVQQVADYQLVGQVVEDGDGFAVYRSEDGIGKLVARGIPDLESAREIAALPRLKSLSRIISSMLENVLDNDIVPEDWFNHEEKEDLARLEAWDTPPSLKFQKTDEDTENLVDLMDKVAEMSMPR